MAANTTTRLWTKPAVCRRTCTVDDALREHHDRLLTIEEGVDGLLDLMELALTWGELDYSETRVVPPMEWSAFVDSHDWRHPDRVRRIFDLAFDVALRSDANALSLPVQAAPLVRQIVRV